MLSGPFPYPKRLGSGGTQLGGDQGALGTTARMALEEGNGDDGVSPLMLACARGHESAVQLLLDRGDDLDVAHPRTGCTAFHQACIHGNEACVRALMQAGCDPAAKDMSTSGRTGEDWARLNGHAMVLYVLHGAERRGNEVNLRVLSTAYVSVIPLEVSEACLQAAGQGAGGTQLILALPLRPLLPPSPADAGAAGCIHTGGEELAARDGRRGVRDSASVYPPQRNACPSPRQLTSGWVVARLEHIFSPFGPIYEAQVVEVGCGGGTSAGSGCGYVRYYCLHDATAARDCLNGKNVRGRACRISLGAQAAASQTLACTRAGLTGISLCDACSGRN
eukprot:COSAG01_NODE_1038_length_11978_cov_4.983500_2_plen_335_part_00